MSEKLQKSLAFLNDEMPKQWLSLAVTQLPQRNIFQSIGDFFAAKSGNHRISYLTAAESEVKVIHYQGFAVVGTHAIPMTSMESLEISEGTTEDGVMAIQHVHIEEIKSINKKGIKKLKRHYFKLMPPLLGLNASPIQAVDEIVWAQQVKKSMLLVLKPYSAKIQTRLAEEFRIAEELRIAKELRKAEELRIKEEARQAKIDEKAKIKEAKLLKKEKEKQARLDEKAKIKAEKLLKKDKEKQAKLLEKERRNTEKI